MDVWQITLSDDPLVCRVFETLLSPEEHERARRFRQESDRLRFIQRRGWLRRILASVTGLDAAQMELGVTPHGKPTLLNGPSELSFNLACSQNWMLCAASSGQPVGVDLEHMNPTLEILEIASEHFSRSENAMLLAASGDQQRRLFTQLWTAKEAYLKGIGCGLFIPLREVEVRWETSQRSACTIRCKTVGTEVWKGVELPSHPQFCAMLATPNVTAFPTINRMDVELFEHPCTATTQAVASVPLRPSLR